MVAAASAPAVVPAPAETVALLQPPTAAVATDSCPPARRALGLCELPTP
jgi:angiomotin